MGNKEFTISEITESIKNTLEGNYLFQNIALVGEISNFRLHASGHLYFTLKDEKSQLSAVMFKNYVNDAKKIPKDGDLVVVYGSITLYAPQGKYQFNVKSLDFAGSGKILEQFENSKIKLEKEGVFAKQKDKVIPKFPKQIALITSEGTAAYEDVLKTLNNNFPIVKVKVYNTLVQGAQAASKICERIIQANQDKENELILLVRGGGSIEDLWCFNEEEVAISISNSTLPVITGIGHEIDTTLADYSAKLRAHTPTDAAEKSVPNIDELRQDISVKLDKCTRSLNMKIKNKSLLLQTIVNSQIFKDPYYIVKIKESKLSNQILKLKNVSPENRHKEEVNKLIYLTNKLETVYKEKINRNISKLENQIKLLNLASPLKIIERGYGLIKYNNEVVTSVKKIEKSSKINIQLSDGIIKCIVEEVENE